MPDEVVIIGADGQEHVFPAGFDPKRAASIVRGGATPPAQRAAPAQPTTGENIRNVLEWGGKVLGGAFFGPAGVEAVKHPKTTIATAAIPHARTVAPKLVELGKRGLGMSAQRAGQNIQAATQAAAKAPLNVEGAGREGLRMIDLQAAGGRMPRAATQFMRRVTEPGKPDLTFDEGRDFYSNLSRLSANEFGTLNPTMQRQLNAMRQELHKALVEGAETVGHGKAYESGIKEYAKSARASKQFGDIAGAVTPGRIAKYGAGTGAGLIGLDFLLDALSTRSGR